MSSLLGGVGEELGGGALIPDTPRMRYLLIIMTALKKRHVDWDVEKCMADAKYIIEDLEQKLPLFNRRLHESNDPADVDAR